MVINEGTRASLEIKVFSETSSELQETDTGGEEDKNSNCNLRWQHTLFISSSSTVCAVCCQQSQVKLPCYLLI